LNTISIFWRFPRADAFCSRKLAKIHRKIIMRCGNFRIARDELAANVNALIRKRGALIVNFRKNQQNRNTRGRIAMRNRRIVGFCLEFGLRAVKFRFKRVGRNFYFVPHLRNRQKPLPPQKIKNNRRESPFYRAIECELKVAIMFACFILCKVKLNWNFLLLAMFATALAFVCVGCSGINAGTKRFTRVIFSARTLEE